ncbi:excinuclease ABC subunit UvrC [Candidatus Uhrbacteria bacterium]|jgi:excinuclease ABC subunit C|nr:excinuclease ABC subunit UvrC [Candidatus Uhrbacteria bacterium]MBT7716977.1 excinuclease ABC subunit UvrC [Candidatus Uhrbacteria bacterium]
MIPERVKIQRHAIGNPLQLPLGKGEGLGLPDASGVYLYFDEYDQILYIGKATSLKKRVGSYFNKAHNSRIAELVSKIARIDYIQTSTVIEALVLEANQIKEHKPPYNIMLKDGKSFLYLVITNEDFPKPILLRGHELEREGVRPFQKELSIKAKKKYMAVYGPYTSGVSLKRALDLIRKVIPWSTCEPPEISGKQRPCFDAHIKRCPGVCTGKIDKRTYRKYMKQLITFFEGGRARLLAQLKREMKKYAKEERFEMAEIARRKVFALEHIQDIALITKEDFELPYSAPQEFMFDLDGRIEAYDISNISGTSSVGSMVVFEDGQPVKSKYRKFKIKTVDGPNDVAMMEEVIRRRLNRAKSAPKAWELPQVMIIDGGKPQVNRVKLILKEMNIDIPVIGIAKGFDRKQDRLVFDRTNIELSRVAAAGKELFQKARDEAHRFAVAYHRKLRSKR